MSKAAQNETERPSAGRGGLLDGLRFAAAMLIVVYHYGASAPVELETLHPIFARGYLATDFFLILSGYVLARAYGAKVLGGGISTGAFLVKRIARLWPAQLVVLAGFVAVVTMATAAGLQVAHPEHYQPSDLVEEALLVQAWGLPGGGGWNTPSWSLSALLVCYAAFPLLWRFVSRLSAPAALAAGTLAVMAGDILCRQTLGHALYDLPFNLGVVRALPLFVMGLGVARAVESRLLGPSRAKELVVVAGAWFVGLQTMGRLDLASIGAVAAGILACGSIPVARPMRLLEQGAKLSFALFITHALTGLVWFGAIHQLELPTALRWLGWAAAFPVTLGAAMAFNRYIDGPLQAWITPRLRLRPAPRPATAPSA